MASQALVQVAYAIGVAQPVSLCVDTRGTARVNLTDSEIAEVVKGMKCFDMTPYAIEKRFDLRKPIYSETAAYGHMGRHPEVVEKQFGPEGAKVTLRVELFSWEKLDMVDKVKKEFGL